MSLTNPQAKRFNEIAFRVQRLRERAGQYGKLTEIEQDRDDLYDLLVEQLRQETDRQLAEHDAATSDGGR